MRPTRRGWGAAAVAAGGFVLAWAFGARSLNAVVAPVLVALGAGLLQAVRTPDPEVARTRPAPGFPGETRTVELTVDTGANGTVRDAVPEGLRALGASASFAGGTTVEYDLELLARGERELGPAVVEYGDALGLFSTEIRAGTYTPVLVYPEVRPIANPRAFDRLIEQAGTPDRQAFERLREYVPGDALRDVDWKASAKRPDDGLVVTEFAAEDEGGVTVVAEAAPGHGDEAASAAASVAVHLFDAGLRVNVACPGGAVEGASGDEGRDRVLELLARTPAGRVATERRDDADVVASADGDGVRVRVEGSTYEFDDLTDPEWTVAEGGEVVA